MSHHSKPKSKATAASGSVTTPSTTASNAFPGAGAVKSNKSSKLKNASEAKSKSANMSAASSIADANPKSKTSKSQSSKKSKNNRKSGTKSLKANSSAKSIKSSIVPASKKSKTSKSKKKSAGNQMVSLKMKSGASGKSTKSAGKSNPEQQHAIATACNMKAPSSLEESNALSKVIPAKELASMQDIEEAGYKIGAEITENDTDKFFKATYKGEEILCKRIDLAKCTPRKRENLLVTALRVERFMCGADQTGQAKSPHFIKLFDIFAVDGCIYSLMKYESGKSLYCRLVEAEQVSARSQRQWSVEMVQAVQKMQEVGVAHRNLTLHHILFDGLDRVKIAAWSKSVIYWDPEANGGAALLQKPERRSRKNSYLPPECFCGLYDPSKVDIWSIGVLMVAMNTHRQPFNANSGFKISAQWRQFVTVHPINKLLRAVCNKIFWIDPKRRIKLSELLKHNYFTAPLEKIDHKEVKTSIDPKHKPEMFGGMDPSVKIGQDAGPRPTSGVGSTTRKKSKAKPKSASSGTSRKKSASRSSSRSSSVVASDSIAENDPGSDAASGSEGGSITDSASENESEYESQEAENSAPEESASSAEPVSVSRSDMSSSAASSGSSNDASSKSSK